MAALQLYAKLVAAVNGQMLHQQTQIKIVDQVNEPCRICVSSAMPMAGFELDAHKRLGERVKLSVHVLDYSKRPAGPSEAPLLEIEGPIVFSETVAEIDESVVTTLVVENQPAPADREDE